MAQRTARQPGKRRPTRSLIWKRQACRRRPTAIIEYGALRVRDGQSWQRNLSLLVHGAGHRCPPSSQQLTGLTRIEDCTGRGWKNGRCTGSSFWNLSGKDAAGGVQHFDLIWSSCGRPVRETRSSILHQPANASTCCRLRGGRLIGDCQTIKLLTLAQHFGLADRVEHRALPDCRLTQQALLQN